jgi:MFS family permease
MKESRSLSRAPLRELFLQWRNVRYLLVGTFGCVAGQAVLFYASTFYAFFFIERIARVDGSTATLLAGCALAIGAPLVLLSGWLSDRIGRRPVLLGGLLLAVLGYFPLFAALLTAANPALARAQQDSPVVVHAARDDCSLQFDPLGNRRYEQRSCDIVKSLLARTGVGHVTKPLAGPGPARLEIGGKAMTAPDPRALSGAELAAAVVAFQSGATHALELAGYRSQAHPADIDRPRVVGILVLLLFVAALCTGSYGALLVELFPARIRYSAVSFPQHFGNGWFGGLLPAVAFMIVAATGNVFAGLWYPVGVAALCFVVGALGLPETRGRPVE